MGTVRLSQDRRGRWFAITVRPMAINFPVRINNQTYWEDKHELTALLDHLGYTIARRG